MADKAFPQSRLPIRRSVEFLPTVFQTETNEKFLAGTFDPLIQPGVLERTVGYIGRRYGTTYKGSSVYLDTDASLRTSYQLEPGVVIKDEVENIKSFHDYLDFKNQLKFFNSNSDRDDKLNFQEHYSWNPPIDWDKFVNYREYYWLPLGPDPVAIAGQRQGIQSTYKVKQGTVASWIFTPDAFTNNPDIVLYRGQTYEFTINSPGEPFIIRTNYDTGSFYYIPNKFYAAGDLALYNGKLWRAKVDIEPQDGSSIELDSQDWVLVDEFATRNALDYAEGVTNNGIETGTLIFEVPLDAPDILYYQSATNPNRVGRFILSDVESNTSINVEKEIIGKTYYTSSNGIQFTNGLLVEFLGQVEPSVYASSTWLVEGVGSAITLTRFDDLVPPTLTTDVPEVLYDNEGFDTQPFDDATSFPTQKDYITIARNSDDKNPWSRYNRWFHRNTIETAFKEKGRAFNANEFMRAKRPIIEFKPDIKLYNHGIHAKATVDYVDTFTTDVFSNIEGSTSYNIDGEFLFEGARVLVVADTDLLANNRIYEVRFIIHNGRRQINLKETDDSSSNNGDCVLVRRGTSNAGSMFHYDGNSWIRSQEKTSVNQSPLFDVFDENGVSYSDEETYPSTTFIGTKILSYRVGSGPRDSELGFSISYLNIDNVGDIQFNWDWDTDKFEWTELQQTYEKTIASGYYLNNSDYQNGWIDTNNRFLQPIIDSATLIAETSSVRLLTVDWNAVEEQDDSKINFYLNGIPLKDTYTRVYNTFTFDNTKFVENDVLTVKVVADVEPINGYYEIPAGLERNPLNSPVKTFTLGQAMNHLTTSLEFDERFEGTIPGPSNLRDIDDYQQNAKRFMKHAGISPLSTTLICDKTYNIVKSIEYSSRMYTAFKNNFLKRAIEINYIDNVPDFVDKIINELTITKTIESPFSDSDMIGAGAFGSIDYVVEDPGIKTFTLSQQFNLEELSRRAVYVYLNGRQLLHKKDYEFNSTFSFITLKVDLTEGDTIQIREYVSTAFCHIPATPTKMGMYKKYTPRKFLDDTYVVPKEVIQGHDGSITVAYGDYRDDLLLELEYRIYNNIKVEYDPNVFDFDSVVSGYYSEGLYSKQEFDDIVNQSFLRWVNNIGVNYTLNEYIDTEDTFTYTYSNMTDPTRTQNLPGWWRGVYQWFYDTDRPHTCPWEMLGFSEQPDWWEDEYGPAPYTSGNLILWEDLENGIIRQGTRAGTYSRYKRTGMLAHLPVNEDGELVSPLISGLANDFTLINNKGPFLFGDIAPVEYAWRSSSEWPFAVVLAMCLLRPFDFITANLNRATTVQNKVGQLVNRDTRLYQTLSDIVVPVPGESLSSGLMNYLVSFVKSKGISISSLTDLIQGIDVQLSTRLSGFADKEQQRYLLDSKNPSSSSSNIYIPQENYNIIFNVTSPIRSVTYSGVILQKTEGGWVITGYDSIQPYFTYYEVVPNQKDPLLSVGGISETFVRWASNTLYNNGVICLYKNDYYRCLATHTSTDVFENNKWAKLPKLPLVGAVEARKRKNFNKLKTSRLSYGTLLRSIQEVVDFLLGYESYLKNQGFIFNGYDSVNKASQDWTTSCKEFMFWTKHNWAIDSLITLSPAAQFIELDIQVGVVDNLLDSFYDYNVLKGDGQPLDPKFIDVSRDFKKFKIATKNTTEGLYYVKMYYVLKEHVTIFDDKTVFNDVIFDKTTGYRQERIKSQGYRTSDWDGDYTSPGFIFDNVNIEAWAPFTDYKLGDIVSYKSRFRTSKRNHTSEETFNENNWTILDSTPEKQLVANFDFKINEFEDYFDVSTDGIGKSQRELARHTIGYQSRNYLENLAEDPVTQFQLYQGFIREKGTNNAISKVFDKLSTRQGDGSVTLNEDWAFRIGNLGGTDQLTEVEVELFKEQFKLDPQPLIFTRDKSGIFYDLYYRIPKEEFTIKPIPFDTSINPTSYEAEPTLVAGYVKIGQTDFVVRDRDQILNININQVLDNDHIWITFDNYTWSTLRVRVAQELIVLDAIKDTDTTITLTLNIPNSLEVGDIIGIKNIKNIAGFYKVIQEGIVRDSAGSEYQVVLEASEDKEEPEIDSTITNVYILEEARFSSYETLDPQEAALLKTGGKLWIDNNGNNQWEVVQKTNQYFSKMITEYGITDPRTTGYRVLYNTTNNNVITSMPALGYVMSYIETSTGLSIKQIIEPPVNLVDKINKSFGYGMTLSPDNKWLAVGAPLAGNIETRFQGEFDPDDTYLEDDIVSYAGMLWRAKTNLTGDGSTITVYSDLWEQVNIIESPTSIGTGSTAEKYDKQGVVVLYEYADQQWNHRVTLVSRVPSENENFGNDVVIGKTATGYTMAVAAPGAMEEKGRVHLFEYTSDKGWQFAANTNYRGIYEPGGLDLPASSIRKGRKYKIVSVGDTDFTSVGAPANVVTPTTGPNSWGFLANDTFDGIYAGTGIVEYKPEYPKGSIVWDNGSLWQAVYDVVADGSVLTLENSSDWLKLDPVVTESTLPQSISIEDGDGSTLATGVLNSLQVGELVKQGDRFGTTLAMNYDASVLVVGAPDADGQYFAKYKGIWRPNREYREGDVVQYQGAYHRLIEQKLVSASDFSKNYRYTIVSLGTTNWNEVAGTGSFSPSPTFDIVYNVGDTVVAVKNGFSGTGTAWEETDSTLVSYNEEPDEGFPWEPVSDSTVESTGKVLVYRKDQYGIYQLDQSITRASLDLFNDLDPSEQISSGDKFGHAISIDYTGNVLVVTSPKADINFQNQGSAYVFRYETQFRLKQKLESYERFPNEYFGQSVCISPNTGKIIIGANNSLYSGKTNFDQSATTFDENRTSFVSYRGFAGSVYVYELKENTYFLTEKLQDELSLNESFGWSVKCTDSIIVVGSPTYVAPAPHGPGLAFEGDQIGTVRKFEKDVSVEPWTVIAQQEPVVHIDKLKSLALYDNVNNLKIQDLEIHDPAKARILNSAEQELEFKTAFDPAVYSTGDDTVVVDSSIAWTDKHVGQLWWDLSTAKWVYYEQGDTAYRLGNWGTLAEGASIDVYEWVKSRLLPSEWFGLADITEGLAEGISGTPKHTNDTIYSIKNVYNPLTREVVDTFYYYWVRNTVVVPQNVVGRRISAANVANVIRGPAEQNLTYAVLAAKDKIFAYNFDNVIDTDTALLNIQYYKTLYGIQNVVHNEYQLLTEGVADSVPTDKLERKWIDSLVGYDVEGNRVPDPDLPAKQKYGLNFRPRQSMFVDRIKLLKMLVDKVNGILKEQPFATLINFDNLNSVEQKPDVLLDLYDQEVENYIDLQTVGTVRTTQAVLRANIVDGEVASIDIINPGYGYRVAPPIVIEGTGSGAIAEATIDNQGRISSVTVLRRGRKYSIALVKVRQFSVLVNVDENSNGFWGIYAWDENRKAFYRTRSQAYDTTRYWSYKDWWKEGYTASSRITNEIPLIIDEGKLNTEIGDLIRIKEYGSGGWAVFEKIADEPVNPFDNYQLIGREGGTIEILSSIYDTTVSGIGYDNTKSFDTGLYDIENSNELRFILAALKEDIFTGDYRVYWNDLFFTSVRYALYEQTYVDWVFKTSFLSATHTVGCFCRRPNYKSDGLDYFRQYIEEVKPYRTSIRNYTSRYEEIETAPAATTDFDLPPAYDSESERIFAVDENNYRIDQYPWKWWKDNKGYSIVSIEVASPGEEYINVPNVVITGDGTGATAQAYISNGRLVSVRVTNPGSGYTKSPTVLIVGGNAPGAAQAKAVAILGDSVARVMNLGIKFDRISKEGLYQNFNFSQTIVASGATSVFDLTYAPNRDKSKIRITINDQVVLSSDYTLSLYTAKVDTFRTILRGKIIFNASPVNGDVIKIEYEKNDQLLDAVNRIEKYYDPASGMKGKELGQLMTGIDFGGVQVQGTTFEVTGGWDALPWFTDSWDSVNAASDYYVVADGSTTYVTLPYVPAVGQEINVYLKRAGTGIPSTLDGFQYTREVEAPPVIRIDDPNYTDQWDSSNVVNPNAQMPTFIGDGVTDTIEIGIYISTEPGDILIFRPIESDGSVTITDPNLVDTNVGGGSLSALESTGTRVAPNTIDGIYAVATGRTAEEILIDGDKFISPDQVQSPEEQIPGQVLDSLSVKVFQKSIYNSPTLKTKIVTSDGATNTYDIGQAVLESNSVLIYVDKVRIDDFTVELGNNQVILDVIPPKGAVIEILSIGIGGVDILDYQEYIADGTTRFYLTNANYEDTSTIFVTVNGERADAGFVNSTGETETTDRTLIEFADPPARLAKIKILCLGVNATIESIATGIVSAKEQVVVYDGSTNSINLNDYVTSSRGSVIPSTIVQVNDRLLRGVDTIYFVASEEYLTTLIIPVGLTDALGNPVLDGNGDPVLTTQTRDVYEIVIGVDPEEPAGAVLPTDLQVFINGELKTFVQDYVYDGTTKTITIEANTVNFGDEIRVENSYRTEYNIVNNNLEILNPASLSQDDVITIYWFEEYPSMDILSDEKVGGKVNFPLQRIPISADYVWVYKNGIRLTQDIDYEVSLPKGIVTLIEDSVEQDLIKIITFGSVTYSLPTAFEIHKDMLNVYNFKRYSRTDVVLAKPLNYFDLTIEVNDASELDEPIASRNIPGVVVINNERIEYLQKTGNILSQLRRGSAGTSIKEYSPAGTSVVNMGPEQSLPYKESQEKLDFYSDGSSLMIGPLGYVPRKSNTSATWYRSSIPLNYGQCDIIEVFAAGRRLRKTPLTVFDETLGDSSPSGNRTLEAEFTVDGESQFVRLTDALPAGTRISIIKRVGNSWYDRGENTAANGVTLTENNSAIAKFIAEKTTKLPE